MEMPELLSVVQAANLLGISKRSLYGLWERREGPATILIGRRRLVRRQACEAFIEAREREYFVERTADQAAAESRCSADA
jgi:excisionase family DNA binding protein